MVKDAQSGSGKMRRKRARWSRGVVREQLQQTVPHIVLRRTIVRDFAILEPRDGAGFGSPFECEKGCPM